MHRHPRRLIWSPTRPPPISATASSACGTSSNTAGEGSTMTAG